MCNGPAPMTLGPSQTTIYKQDARATEMDPMGLPVDIFIHIIAQLPPRACVRMRRVSRQWRNVLDCEWFSRALLCLKYPQCRESRILQAAVTLLSLDPDLLRPKSGATDGFKSRSAAEIWLDVAERYHRLRLGLPRACAKLDQLCQTTNCSCSRAHVLSFKGVPPWRRFLREGRGSCSFQPLEPSWSYSMEDGLLVHTPNRSEAAIDGRAFVVLDLETGAATVVPFDVRNKHVRRVRLAQGLLVLEWAEAWPTQAASDGQAEAYRHFVDALDISRVPGDCPGTWKLAAVFRSSWLLHGHAGLRLSQRDRFFSAHTATHYAVYFKRWSGRERGPSTEEVFVLDVSRGTAPHVMRHLRPHDLDFYGLRQTAGVRMRNLALDTTNLYFVEEDHGTLRGLHVFRLWSRPRGHWVRSTAIPVLLGQKGQATVSTPVFGPHWVDSCGHEDGGANIDFCRRSRTISGVAAQEGRTPELREIFSSPALTGALSYNLARTLGTAQGMGLDLQNMAAPRLACLSHRRKALARTAVRELATNAHRSRWPGFAPCWRHVEFPYLATAEMTDLAAGVRVVARCWHGRWHGGLSMPASMRHGSVLIRVDTASSAPPYDEPLSVADQLGVPGGSLSRSPPPEAFDTVEDGFMCNRESLNTGTAHEGRLSAALSLDHFAGDERWLLGRGEDGSIAVLRF